jgi:hypothetical protein
MAASLAVQGLSIRCNDAVPRILAIVGSVVATVIASGDLDEHWILRRMINR